MFRHLFLSFPRSAQFALIALALTIPSAMVSAAEQAELTEAQKTLLELQLKEHYKCELDTILFSREVEVGGRKQLEGRIRCVDQREIDYTQAGDNQKFQLRLCMPTVC